MEHIDLKIFWAMLKAFIFIIPTTHRNVRLGLDLQNCPTLTFNVLSFSVGVCHSFKKEAYLPKHPDAAWLLSRRQNRRVPCLCCAPNLAMSMQRTGGTVPLHGLGGWRASMGADRINTEDMSGTSQSPGGVTLSRSCCRPCRRLPHVLFNEKREFYGEGGGGGNLQIFILLWNDFFFLYMWDFQKLASRAVL